MTPLAELPDELIREILIRLPVQSLIPFRCVSKSWLSLLTDPGFIKDQSIRNHLDKYDYLIANKNYEIFVLSRYKETSSGLPFDKYELIGSVRGLVCLRRLVCHRQHHTLLLWNPAIKQYKEFTHPVPSHSFNPTHIGLGFDFVNNDYKVVVVCHLRGDLRRAYVYSSSSASWTDLFIPDNVFPPNYTFSAFRGDIVAPKAIVKDCPYWIYTTSESDEMYKIVWPVKFDAGSNKFKLLPSYRLDVSDSLRKMKFEFVNMDDNLSIVEYEQTSTTICFHVHSLKEERHWVDSMHYTVESRDFYFVRTVGRLRGFDRDHEIDFLRKIRPTQGFEIDGKIVLHENGIFLCNAHKTNIIKPICGRSCTKSSMCCFRYKPSLAFLRGMKPVHSRNQTSTSCG